MARARSSIVPFVVVETALLLVLVVLVAHIRSFAEQLVYARRAGVLPEFAPDEGWYILARSLLMVLALQVCFAFRDLYRWSVITRPQITVVRLVTPPDGIVLEPFAGSGTTVEAAVLEGMRCIAIEREETYGSLIAERMARAGLVVLP